MPPSRIAGATRLGLIALSTAAALWLTLAVTLPDLAGPFDVDLSVGHWPPNSEQRIRATTSTLVGGEADKQSGTMQALAVEVARAPLYVEGFSSLGFLTEARGNGERARKLFSYAHFLSRRDATTELWMIEDRVKAGDIRGALTHYDHGLRTSGRMRSVLLPTLVAASADPLVAEPLRRLLARKPPWWIYFAEQLTAGLTNPRTATPLILDFHLDPQDQRQRSVLLTAITRLISLDAFEQARTVANQASPGATASSTVFDGSFEEPPGLPPFGWELTDELSLAAVQEPRTGANGERALTLLAENGRGGPVARQMLLLAPGRYALGGIAGNVSGAEGDRPAIVIACTQNTENPRLRLELPLAASSHGFAGEFSIPGGCQAQWLTVVASAPARSSDEMPWVDDIRIEPRR